MERRKRGKEETINLEIKEKKENNSLERIGKRGNNELRHNGRKRKTISREIL